MFGFKFYDLYSQFLATQSVILGMLWPFSAEEFWGRICIGSCKYPSQLFRCRTGYDRSRPPGTQADYERWSLVFFTRPGNSVLLEPLANQSPMIAESVAKAPANKFHTGSTSFEWFTRRIKNQRIANRMVMSFVWSVRFLLLMILWLVGSGNVEG